MGAGMITSGLNTFREEAGRIEAAFAKATREQPFTAEWRLVTAQGKGVAETVMEHGRSADLIMASQRDPSWDFHTLLDEPERLAVESGRPVLLIPYAGQFSSFGKRVTIAWNGRREAARADSTPCRCWNGSTVRTCGSIRKTGADTGNIPTAEIAAALARHGVKCETATTAAADIDVGDVLLSSLADDGCDLLVMGAYGRSRLREFVFGGATRHILRSMTVPVLMSH
jgi:hypothetical protein